MGIIGWAVFGAGIRFFQLGIEMRPFLARNTALGYPIFAGVTAVFGYYIEGAEARQFEMLEERKNALIAKRRRQAEREGRGDTFVGGREGAVQPGSTAM